MRPPAASRPRVPLSGRAARRLLLAALLAGVWLAPSPPRAQDTDEAELEQTRTQIKELELEREQLRRRLETYRSSERQALEQIRRLTREVRQAKRRRRELNQRRQALVRERERRAERIASLKEKIAASRERLGEHLRRMYKLSKLQDSGSLVSLAGYKTYFKDSRYLERLSRMDRQALARFQKLRAELAKAQEADREALEALAEVRKSLEVEQTRLSKAEAALERSLAKIRENQSLYQRYLADLEEALGDMEQALADLEAEARPEAPRQAADPASLRGELPAPASGRVLAGFGEQDPRYRLKKFQRGIVIRVGEAAPVRAVAPGRAVHAGPFRGYQSLVVLDHGAGLFTVYGHLERLQVERDAWVEAGATLGHATYQPADGAYNVYFEVRLDGEPQDPGDWLAPGALNGQTARNAG